MERTKETPKNDPEYSEGEDSGDEDPESKSLLPKNEDKKAEEMKEVAHNTQDGSVEDEEEFNISKSDSKALSVQQDKSAIYQTRITALVMYTRSSAKTCTAILLTICTIGLIQLFALWNPMLQVWLYYTKTKKGDWENTTHIQVTSVNINVKDKKDRDIVELHKVTLDQPIRADSNHEEGDNTHAHNLTKYLFTYKYTTYVFDEAIGKFVELKYDYHRPFKVLKKRIKGIKEKDRDNLEKMYGKCVMELYVKPWYLILLQDVVNAFYMFQIFSLSAWMTVAYYQYGATMVFMIGISLYGEFSNIYENLYRLKDMAYFQCDVMVRRRDDNGNIKQPEKIKSGELVPGDIFVVPEKQKMPCDALLMHGESIMNEAMLTGESLPAVKSPIPDSDTVLRDFSIENKDQEKYFLFSGTEVIQNRYGGEDGVLAMAVKTGFMSAKGELVKSILYPSPSRFRFKEETHILLFSFFCICVCTLVSTYHALFKYHSPWHIMMNIITALTLAVPPEFPIVMSMGILFSLRRLRLRNIFCIDSSKINVAGRISIMVFDKTGTLTEDGLTVNSSKIKSQSCRRFEKKIKYDKDIPVPDGVFDDQSTYDKHKDNVNLKYLECMATCHQVNILEGEYFGDPLDVEMFKTSQWSILDNSDSKVSAEDPVETCAYPPVIKARIDDREKKEDKKLVTDDCYQLKIEHRFDFSSKLQCMSAIVKNRFDEENKYTVYIKGSPEMIKKMCKEETYPKDDYDKTLRKYTQKGLRVIGLGYKYAPDFDPKTTETLKRGSIEVHNTFTFLGFLILVNRLKPETKGAINELKEGHVEVYMATGDNALTGICVGQKCDILNSEEYFIADINKKGNQLVWDHEFRENIVGKKREGHEHHENEGADGEPSLDETATIMSSRRGISSHEESKSKSGEIKKPKKEGNNHPEDKSKEGDDHHEDEQTEDESPESIEIFNRFIEDKEGKYEIAMTGKALQLVADLRHDGGKIKGYPAEYILQKVLRQGRVFSRMSPAHKALLVQELQKDTGEMVGMCGDGANDCSALKASDAGLSLSEAEASIVAPFTSKEANIGSLCTLLRLGRASLDLSFELLKYMMVYSCIQFCSDCILYQSTSAISDTQLVYYDMGCVVPITILLCWTEARDKLADSLPLGTLIGAPILTSIIGQMLIQSACQVGAYWMIYGMGWYHGVHKRDHTHVHNYVVTTIFLFTLPQYLFIGIAFHISTKFRRDIYTNIPFVVMLICGASLSYWMILLPLPWMRYCLQLRKLKMYFKVMIAGGTIINGIMTLAWEQIVICLFGKSEKLTKKPPMELTDAK